MKRNLFGTDGVRGIAGEYPLNEDGLVRIGRAVGSYFKAQGKQVLIGQDTRESSKELVSHLVSGLNSVGVDVVSVGVIPTPGLAYLTGKNDFACGVMVTASHNTYEFNGVKVFDESGGKLSDKTEARLNALIDSKIDPSGSGNYSNDTELIRQYEDFLVASAPDLTLAGMKVAIDSANGAAYNLAQKVFERLGASVTPMFNKPNGKNINDHCGATDTTALADLVKKQGLDLGVALDGDADRLVMIDERGREVKGDYMLYIMAVVRHAEGVVATVMSNLGFEAALSQKGIKLLRTQVGDRYVLEGLRKSGYKLGGEQSGHIIFPLVLSTGDGLLASVQIVRALQTSGRSLADWCDEVHLIPQATVNIKLSDKSLLEKAAVKDYIRRQNQALTGKGRLLIRPSGTEPVLRVMVEADEAEEKANLIANELSKLLN